MDLLLWSVLSLGSPDRGSTNGYHLEGLRTVVRMGIAGLRKGGTLALARVLPLPGRTYMYSSSGILLAIDCCAPVVQTCPPPSESGADSSPWPDVDRHLQVHVSVIWKYRHRSSQITQSPISCHSLPLLDLKFEASVVNFFWNRTIQGRGTPRPSRGSQTLQKGSPNSKVDSTMRSLCRSQMSPYSEVH